MLSIFRLWVHSLTQCEETRQCSTPHVTPSSTQREETRQCSTPHVTPSSKPGMDPPLMWHPVVVNVKKPGRDTHSFLQYLCLWKNSLRNWCAGSGVGDLKKNFFSLNIDLSTRKYITHVLEKDTPLRIITTPLLP
jgi:hypothetical protein